MYYGDNRDNTDDVMSVMQWVGVILILGIPIVNIIMYFIWAFSSTTNENLRNFCKATLLITAVAIVFIFLFAGCSMLLLS